jgi:hypothetical protein
MKFLFIFGAFWLISQSLLSNDKVVIDNSNFKALRLKYDSMIVAKQDIYKKKFYERINSADTVGLNFKYIPVFELRPLSINDEVKAEIEIGEDLCLYAFRNDSVKYFSRGTLSGRDFMISSYTELYVQQIKIEYDFHSEKNMKNPSEYNGIIDIHNSMNKILEDIRKTDLFLLKMLKCRYVFAPLQTEIYPEVWVTIDDDKCRAFSDSYIDFSNYERNPVADSAALIQAEFKRKIDENMLKESRNYVLASSNLISKEEKEYERLSQWWKKMSLFIIRRDSNIINKIFKSKYDVKSFKKLDTTVLNNIVKNINEAEIGIVPILIKSACQMTDSTKLDYENISDVFENIDINSIKIYFVYYKFKNSIVTLYCYQKNQSLEVHFCGEIPDSISDNIRTIFFSFLGESFTIKLPFSEKMAYLLKSEIYRYKFHKIPCAYYFDAFSSLKKQRLNFITDMFNISNYILLLN